MCIRDRHALSSEKLLLYISMLSICSSYTEVHASEKNATLSISQDPLKTHTSALIVLLKYMHEKLAVMPETNDYHPYKVLWTKEMYLQVYAAVETIKEVFALSKNVTLVNQLTNAFNGLLFNDEYVKRLPSKNMDVKPVQWDAFIHEIRIINDSWLEQLNLLGASAERLFESAQIDKNDQLLKEILTSRLLLNKEPSSSAPLTPKIYTGI